MALRAAEVNTAGPRLIKALHGGCPGLKAAMTYSFAAGGKRLRPALLCAAYEVFGGKPADVLPAACALEMVHTYSLIHDDLPCMDDDDLRRGRPTCHKVYGEAGALLAGDALLTDAFNVLLSSPYPARVRPNLAAAAAVLARRAGTCGMVSGQAADLEAEGFLDRRMSAARRRSEGLELLSYIHLHKTADLITAAVEMGGALAGAGPADISRLSAFGREIGLCFQVADDILDVTADKEKLGKSGSDARNHKLTFVTLLGVEEARRRAAKLLSSALAQLAGVKGSEAAKNRLAGMAEYICKRDK